MDIPVGLRRLGLGLAVLAALVAAAAAGFFVFLHTGPGERWTQARLEAAVPGLALDNYRLGWPFRMRADALRLADTGGPWLEAAAPELVWQPLRLWRRLLDVDRLAAGRVVLHRLPAQPDAPDAKGGPTLVERVRVDEVNLPIRLAPPVLGEAVELELTGTAQMDGAAGNVDVSLRTRNGDLARFAGTAGTDYVDLRWYLRLPDLARWKRLAGTRLSGDATGTGIVAGRLPVPDISGRVDIGPGTADHLAWQQLTVSGRVMPEAGRWRLGLRADAAAPSWDGRALPGGGASLAIAGDLDPQAGRLRLGLARLENATLTAEAAGLVEQWGRHAVLRLRGSGDLGALGAAGVAGRGRLRGLAAGTPDDLTLRLAVDGSGVATGVAMLDRALGPSPRGLVTARLRDGRLSLGPSRLGGARARLVAEGAVLPRLDLWARLALPHASVLADGLNGGATVFAHMGGAPAAPRAAGIAALNEVSMGGAPAGNGALAFDLTEPAVPRGHLSADLRVAGTPLAASARLDRGKAVRLDDLRLAAGDSTISGAVEFAGGVRGRLTGTIPELGQWEGLLGRPLAGRVEADAVLDPGDGQSLRLSLRASALDLGAVQVPALAARLEASGLSAKPRGSVSLDGDAVAAGRTVEAVRLRIAGTADHLRLDRLEARVEGMAVRLVEPAEVRRHGGAVALLPAALAIGGGRAVIQGRIDDRAVNGVVRFEALPLAVAGVDAVGTLSGAVEAAGTVDRPRLHVAVSGRNLALARVRQAGLGRLLANLEGDWADNRFSGRAEITDAHSLRASAEGSLPLPGDGPLDGRLRLSGDAGRLVEALPLAGHVVSGRLDGAASVAGTLSAPRIDGRAELAGGRYENLDSGTVVMPLHAIARLNGDTVAVEAEGGDGGDGRLRLNGDGRLRLNGGGRLDGGYGAELVLDRFTALRRDDIEASASGTLRLDQGRLSGRLAVPRAEVDVGQLRGGGPARLEVVEINKPGTPPPAAAPPPAPTEPAALDLAVRVAVEHAFVRGRGLDSEWQGELDAGGTTARPSLTGRLTAARGQFDLLGKAFRLTPDSTVTFQGGDTIDPALDITAEAAAADITAQVRVAGTAKAPELTFTSSPPLPGDEVLARVLFGREAGKLSAFQQIQLAQMAAGGLTGGGGGFDPLGDVRGFLGLDVLGVGATETGRPGETASPTLSAGKYIAPDTFVRVEQGVAGLGRVTVEQELGGGFAVESSVGAETGGGLGLSWRKNY